MGCSVQCLELISTFEAKYLYKYSKETVWFQSEVLWTAGTKNNVVYPYPVLQHLKVRTCHCFALKKENHKARKFLVLHTTSLAPQPEGQSTLPLVRTTQVRSCTMYPPRYRWSPWLTWTLQGHYLCSLQATSAKSTDPVTCSGKHLLIPNHLVLPRLHHYYRLLTAIYIYITTAILPPFSVFIWPSHQCSSIIRDMLFVCFKWQYFKNYF